MATTIDMTCEEFAARFNQRAEEIGHGLRVDVWNTDGVFEENTVLPIFKDGKQAHYLGLVFGAKGTVQLLSEMQPSAACDGLVVFSTAIDALFDSGVKWRNDLLRRLHLFDGGLSAGKALRTQSKGAIFSVHPNDPARGMMRFGIEMNK